MEAFIMKTNTFNKLLILAALVVGQNICPMDNDIKNTMARLTLSLGQKSSTQEQEQEEINLMKANRELLEKALKENDFVLAQKIWGSVNINFPYYSNGFTLFHMVAIQPQYNIPALLFVINNSAHIDLQNNDRLETPLLKAFWFRHLDKTKCLIENGADIHIKNRDNLSTVFIANKNIEYGLGSVIDNYIINVEAYNTHNSIVVDTPDWNKQSIPDYFTLAVIKENVDDIQNFFTSEKEENIKHYICLAQRLKKDQSLKILIGYQNQKQLAYIKNRDKFSDTRFSFEDLNNK
jgi:hypothetical protein